MNSLQDIRLRKQSVLSTMKLANAMKLVSSIKLKKEQERLDKLRTFSKRLELISKRIFFEDINNYTESKTIDLKERITLIIAIGTNKGLCGAYNVNLGREVKDCSKILEKKNKDYRILIVGKKLDIILKKLVDPSRIIFINQELNPI